MHNFVLGVVVGAIAGSFGGAFVMALMAIGVQSDTLTDRACHDRRGPSRTGGVPRLPMGDRSPRP
jgi:hypothetical protein